MLCIKTTHSPLSSWLSCLFCDCVMVVSCNVSVTVASSSFLQLSCDCAVKNLLTHSLIDCFSDRHCRVLRKERRSAAEGLRWSESDGVGVVWGCDGWTEVPAWSTPTLLTLARLRLAWYFSDVLVDHSFITVWYWISTDCDVMWRSYLLSHSVGKGKVR